MSFGVHATARCQTEHQAGYMPEAACTRKHLWPEPRDSALLPDRKSEEPGGILLPRAKGASPAAQRCLQSTR